MTDHLTRSEQFDMKVGDLKDIQHEPWALMLPWWLTETDRYDDVSYLSVLMAEVENRIDEAYMTEEVAVSPHDNSFNAKFDPTKANDPKHVLTMTEAEMMVLQANAESLATYPDRESEARESCRRLGLDESEWRKEAEELRVLRVRLGVLEGRG